MITPRDWVDNGQYVEARFNNGDVRATGRVLSYTDRPTVGIELADGSHVDWIADMCVPIEPPVEPREDTHE